MISPIPRSLSQAHSFKHKNSINVNSNFVNECDAEFIAELMTSSVNTTPKKPSYKELLQVNTKKADYDDQSRVEFDENIIMNIGLSSSYINHGPNSPRPLCKS